MSWRILTIGGFCCSMIGALAGAGLASWLAPDAAVLVSGATVGAVAGSAIGWHIVGRTGFGAGSTPRDVVS
ncbi:hypothetical protein [Ferruginivarius sediminum]|uniref:Uncharacterized protein n=1 Tax=Ferruginivarius sediminum TaxID=2661937 RepID=A0A369TDP4_9PROT|nr:hypothetical protein [Ferruginivarius sediminum]RDD62287.1 hypothetical protein DRB17_08635 [Ferruginivarius sediminum]